MKNKSFDATSGVWVFIIDGDNTRKVSKEYLETFLYSQMEQMSDPTKVFEIRDYYRDAYEWIFVNLYRACGIQLYSDGEIRINIEPDEIIEGKKCTFLKECEVKNRALDEVLFDELRRICVQGV